MIELNKSPFQVKLEKMAAEKKLSSTSDAVKELAEKRKREKKLKTDSYTTEVESIESSSNMSSNIVIITKLVLVVFILLSVLGAFVLPCILVQQFKEPSLWWTYILTSVWLYDASDLVMKVLKLKM